MSRRWNPLRTLRARLVAASAVAVLVSLMALGGFATVVVEDQLRGGVDRELRRRAVDAAQLAATTPALLSTPGILDPGSGGRQVWLEVRDRQRRLIGHSASLGHRLLPEPAAIGTAVRDGRATYADGRLGGEPIRLYVAPLAETRGDAAGGAVIAATSMQDVEDTFGHLRRVIVIAALVAAALGALLAGLLVTRGLRPLRRLSSGAQAIRAAPEPGRRLPDPATGDELAALGGTLNAMLDALDRARAAERRLLADASHELRNPVTALRGNAAFARRYGADAELLGELEADADRLAVLVDDLLTLEREEGAVAPADTVVLADVVATVCGGAPRVTITVDPELTVRGQVGALERALGNLVANARLHGPAGGTISVSVTREGDEAVVAVQDEGTGIPPEQAETALRRFWRGPTASAERRAGSGLGLAIVAATASRHGGRVRIDGATVALVLPIVRELSEPDRTVRA